MGLGALVSDFVSLGRSSRSPRNGAAPAPSSDVRPGAALNFLDLQAEQRHERLFSHPLDFPRSPAGFRAEDVIGDQELEGFVSVSVAAERMEITEGEVTELARSGYLLARRNRGQLLVRPGIL